MKRDFHPIGGPQPHENSSGPGSEKLHPLCLRVSRVGFFSAHSASRGEKPHKLPVTTLTDLLPQHRRQYPRSTTPECGSAPERGCFCPEAY